MAKTHKKSQEIRDYILSNVDLNPFDIIRKTSVAFGISKQAISPHLNILLADGLLRASGYGKNRQFFLTEAVVEFTIPVIAALSEDGIWREKVRPVLANIPQNIEIICNYGFTEMLNNVIEHSLASSVNIKLIQNPDRIEILIKDNGIGIISKLRKDLSLPDSRQAILELSKGKLTTDPVRHSGEGIFFTSRVFDFFEIRSGNMCFSYDALKSTWQFKDMEEFTGTLVKMIISKRSNRLLEEVFDSYTNRPDDYTFSKTIIPIKLAQYKGEHLISRSQAKRIIYRFDQFKKIVLDFQDVQTIGQSFADEIFRVFVNANPTIEITTVNTDVAIVNMIAHVVKH